MEMFIFTQMIRNKFKVLKMSILEKVKRKKEKIAKNKENRLKETPKPTQQSKKDLDEIYTKLTGEEIKYLISLIGRSEFKGMDLQILYSITAKLQNKLKL